MDRTLKREGGCCIYCGMDLVCNTELLLSAELDHLVPKEAFRNSLASGYSSTGNYKTNLVLSCGPCNDAKGNWPLCLQVNETIRHLTVSTRDEYLAAAKEYILPRRRSEEKRIARLMAKVWTQRASKLNKPSPILKHPT